MNATPQRAHARRSRTRAVLTGAVVLLAVLPPLLMIRYLSGVGANVVALDYVRYVNTMAQIASGHYNWVHLPRDSFVAGTHSIWTVFLIRAAIVKYTAWNSHMEIAVGVVLNLVRAGLVWWAVARVMNSRTLRLVMLAAVSVLIFQPSQMNTFSWGDASIGTGVFGIALGVIMIVTARAQRTRSTTFALAACAVVAPGAGAPGAVVALIACAAAATYLLAERTVRNAVHMGAVWGGAVVGLLPYVLYVAPRSHSGVGARELDLFQPHFFTALLGLPFARGFNQSQATLAGVVCLGLLITVCAGVVATRRQGTWQQLVPAAALTLFGVGNVLLVTLFRGVTHGSVLVGLSGWYSVYSASVWLGIISAAAVVADRVRQRRPAASQPMRIVLPSALIAVSALMLLTNLSFDDKNTNLQAQTPMSASCVRHYQSAPPICELFAFSWSQRDSTWLHQLGSPLQHEKLSVFAPHQTWTLQGDWALPTTSILHRSTPNGVRWSSPPITFAPWDASRPLPRASWHHLDLILEPGSAVSWAPAVPASSHDVTLHTVVRSCSGSAATVVVTARSMRGASRKVTWHGGPHELRLPAYGAGGMQLELRAAARQRSCVRLEYPTLTLHALQGTAPARTPRDAEYVGASESTLPAFTDQHFWGTHDLVPSVSVPGGAFTPQRYPNVATLEPLDICVDHLQAIRFGIEQHNIVHRMIVLQYRLAGQRIFPRRQSVPIPLDTVKSFGTYRLDAKLLGLPADAHIDALRVLPTPVATGNLHTQWIRMSPIVLEWRNAATWTGHRRACTNTYVAAT